MAASTKSYRVQLTEILPDDVGSKEADDGVSSNDGDSNISIKGSDEDADSNISIKGSDDDCDRLAEVEDVVDDIELSSSGNPGWADAMAKILKTKKPKGKKSIVLSKAKRLNMIKEKTQKSSPGFEIEGEIKEEKPDIALISVNQQSRQKKTTTGVKRKDWESRGRVKPSVLERNREKAIAKIATKGVVQLFNAVREHQKSVGSQLKEAGASERKREKVLKSIDKRAFLDVLMGNTKSEIVEEHDPETKPEIKEEEDGEARPGSWQVLRDDFMMGAKFKDWDKQGKVPVQSSETVVSEESDDDDD